QVLSEEEAAYIRARTHCAMVGAESARRRQGGRRQADRFREGRHRECAGRYSKLQAHLLFIAAWTHPCRRLRHPQRMEGFELSEGTRIQVLGLLHLGREASAAFDLQIAATRFDA